ncbi:hypothetical protein BKA70DRAFT_1242990 [Coprinopsis sp. MPI-PUGE-AT-0042]|nr:hypothetical protein BKA70DRAFT_1242990 [Coprinopsis sp. MPI-PUGE-AT-0042]
MSILLCPLLHTLYSGICPAIEAVLWSFLVIHYQKLEVNSAQVQTAHSPPQILHWTLTWNKLSEWAWPSDSDTRERVPPSDLEGHQQTHYFMAPCCLCPLLLGEMYIESKIGLAVVAPGSVRFYARKILKVNAYKKREAPLEPHQLNYISDLAPEHEEMLGLPQALPSSSIWSRGPRKFDHPEAPELLDESDGVCECARPRVQHNTPKKTRLIGRVLANERLVNAAFSEGIPYGTAKNLLAKFRATGSVSNRP